MACESIPGTSIVQFDHPGVARGLGDDRCCGNGSDSRVSLDDHFGWIWKPEIVATVGKDDIGRLAELIERAPIGQAERGAEPDVIQFTRVDPTDRPL